ncbi:MAG: hypothetical protein U0169_14430 [Polyangiaceae bacterium]
MQKLVSDHHALLLKHARRTVRVNTLKVSAEDVAREFEMMLLQLGKEHGIDDDAVPSPDFFFRALVGHAANRVKRRRTLIQQIAAGDDLEEVSRDLAAVDADLPPVPESPTDEQVADRELVRSLKAALPPRDALAFALLAEDQFTAEEAGKLVSTDPEALEDARDRYLEAARVLGVEPIPELRDPSTAAETEPKRLDVRVRRAAGNGPIPSPLGGHVEEPLIRLVRDGDLSDDLDDAIAHLAECPDCRARLTEGELRKKSVVVVAIEAPKASTRDLERAASGSRAALVERGEGRWTALMTPEAVETFKGKLTKEDSSVVTRLAIASPVDVLVKRSAMSELPPAPSSSRHTVPVLSAAVDSGTSAAEVQAWAKLLREPKRKVEGVHPGWTAFAVLAVASAIGIAYLLAIR